MTALSTWMDRTLTAPFSFLDLGCGDASFTAGVLKGRPIARYGGVDLSPVALDLARENTRVLGVPAEFHCSDFSDGPDGQWDVIYVGLSFHHIASPAAKSEFLTRVRAALPPGGHFVFFEPARRNDESRAEYMDRWMADVREHWTGLTADDVAAVEGHVTQYDFPETVDAYRDLALAAGFRGADVIFRDDQDFYAIVVLAA